MTFSWIIGARSGVRSYLRGVLGCKNVATRKMYSMSWDRKWENSVKGRDRASSFAGAEKRLALNSSRIWD